MFGAARRPPAPRPAVWVRCARRQTGGSAAGVDIERRIPVVTVQRFQHCGFCTFSTADGDSFAEHLRTVHGFVAGQSGPSANPSWFERLAWEAKGGIAIGIAAAMLTLAYPSAGTKSLWFIFAVFAVLGTVMLRIVSWTWTLARRLFGAG